MYGVRSKWSKHWSRGCLFCAFAITDQHTFANEANALLKYWAARHNAWLLINLTPKGVFYVFLFFCFNWSCPFRSRRSKRNWSVCQQPRGHCQQPWYQCKKPWGIPRQPRASAAAAASAAARGGNNTPVTHPSPFLFFCCCKVVPNTGVFTLRKFEVQWSWYSNLAHLLPHFVHQFVVLLLQQLHQMDASASWMLHTLSLDWKKWSHRGFPHELYDAHDQLLAPQLCIKAVRVLVS